MKKTLKIALTITGLLLALAGMYSIGVASKAIYNHIQQDHINAHIVDALIDYNVQQGKLVVPPEWIKKPDK